MTGFTNGKVQEDVTYLKVWEIAAVLLARSGPDVPHGWVVGDDEFGRATEFRALLHERNERYVLDVPCNTTIRDLDGPAAVGRSGRAQAIPFVRADLWASNLPDAWWARLTIRDGETGPRGGWWSRRSWHRSAPSSAAGSGRRSGCW